jgi:hypothetical protein
MTVSRGAGVLVLSWALLLGASGVARAQGDADVYRPVRPERLVEFRGFFMAGVERTLSKDSLEAVLGTSDLRLYGGGAEVVIARHWILRGVFTQFSGTGTRVFVAPSGTIFELDIPLEITVRPLEFSAGYRLALPKSLGVYGAAGISRYTVIERSTGETERSTGSGWHVLGGVEASPLRWVFLAAEAQWTKTSEILEGGTADAFDEGRLGGVRAAARLGIRF